MTVMWEFLQSYWGWILFGVMFLFMMRAHGHGDGCGMGGHEDTKQPKERDAVAKVAEEKSDGSARGAVTRGVRFSRPLDSKLWKKVMEMPFWSRKKKDPVCGMAVDPRKAAATLVHMGKIYYFCAPRCKADFAKDPGKYLEGRPIPMGGMGMGHH